MEIPGQISAEIDIVLTRLPQPPKRDSNLIRIGSSAGRLEEGIGSRNDVIELRQFRRSTNGDFVRKTGLATIEARAFRGGLMPVDETDPEGRRRAKQNPNAHFPPPSSLRRMH
jgi:hypothetical protein